MKTTFSSLFIALTMVLPFLSIAQQQAVKKMANTYNLFISRNIYGHFAEHLGRSIYEGFYRKGKIRMDIVEALREIQVPNLRWPGGCFADQYHWRDGISDKSKRPTVKSQILQPLYLKKHLSKPLLGAQKSG